MRPALSAVGLEKRFGAVVAADAISIDVPPGQRVSLIGSNGAGKTTFVNMVTGYLKPDQGQILLDGEDITAMKPQQVVQRGICRSFQIPQLFLEMNTFENLLVAVVAARPKSLSTWRRADAGMDRERAASLLERFGLARYAEQAVTELPGGVRKLLDIAMALARQPKVLLMDEPTSAVSAEEKYATMECVMKALSQESVTVVFVEHDMDIVQRYSERVIAFYSGRVIADDSASVVLADADVKRHVTGHRR